VNHYLQALVRASAPAEGDYAWLVTSTLVPDPDDDTSDFPALVEENPQDSRNGVTGPHNAPPALLAQLADGEGREWRTLFDRDGEGHTDDKRVCHVGRYLDWGDVEPGSDRGENVDGDAEFGPLTDLSMPDCGACEIQYKQPDGTWKTL
jgi:hypothetical protein